MSQVTCPNCGTELDPPAGAAMTTCPVCGTAAILPREARVAPSNGDAGEEAAPLAGEVLLDDDLRDPTSGWDTGAEDGVVVEYTPEGYRVHLESEETFWEAYADVEMEDASVEAEFTRVAGPADGIVGVLCRVSDLGAYTFEVDGEGYYGIYKDVYGETEADDEFYTLAEGNRPGVVNTGDGARNQVRGQCRGTRLTLFVNGREVLSAEDDEYEAGDAGLLASTGESGWGQLDVLFTRFTIRAA